jgi:hypothetical protein
MIYTNGFSLFILNLEQMIIDFTDDADAITMGIMYSNKKNLFIGRSSQSVSKLVYEINSNFNNQNDTTQKVYPNPTKGKIYINLEDKFEFTWQLFNFEGKLLIESKELNQKEIDLTNYPNGIYLLHLQYDGQEKTIKIVLTIVILLNFKEG